MTEFKSNKTKREPKICGVCGNKAIGKNFGAITCEPCKAFFRRNATKNTFECLFESRCQINQVTRKFCQKCRLNKCFAIGMRKEFILNDEERHNRRIKLEAKRLVRQRKQSVDNIASPTTTDQSSPETMTSFCTNSIETNNTNSIEIMFENNTNNNFSIDGNNTYSTLSICSNQTTLLTNNSSTGSLSTCNTSAIDIDFWIPFSDNYSEPNELIMDEIQQNLDPITHSFTNETDISDEVYQKVVEFEMSVIPIAQPIIGNNTSLNDSEHKVLCELLNATKILHTSHPQLPALSEIKTVTDLRQTMNFIYETEIQNIVNVVKGLASFQRLCETDRIALLKNSSIEVLLMRSIMYYNHDQDYLTLPMGNNNTIVLKLDLLKQVRRNLHGAIKKYFYNMMSIWDCDYVILDLLTAIILFNPDNDNLVHKEVIKLQQNIYMHLLKRYLTTKYQADCESKTRFLRIINTMTDIRLLGQIQRQNASDNIEGSSSTPNYVSPLVREIIMES